jgi:hypothetical protein
MLSFIAPIRADPRLSIDECAAPLENSFGAAQACTAPFENSFGAAQACAEPSKT